MSELFQRLDDKKGKDLKVLSEFIAVYCRENHGEDDRETFPIRDDRLRKWLGEKDLVLCNDCTKLLNHGMAKLLLCPYDPKPKCQRCETHCYAPVYREKVREVMKFSGPYMIKHGRLDLMFHYLK